LVSVAACGQASDPAEAGGSPVSMAIGSTPSGCPMPADADARAAAAIEDVNRLRHQAGLGCLALSSAIGAAATRHCQYFVANTGSCVAQPHREREACAGFTGATFEDRLHVASYAGHPAFEIMAYVGDGQTAVEQWLGSIWHRLPLLSPRVDQAGYGLAGGCDTMDFGASGASLEMKISHFPFADEIDVPTLFNGRDESPEPPRPPEGWPSGYPITMWAPGLVVESHALTIDDSGAAVDHIWLTPEDRRAMGLLGEELMIYAYRPLAAQTRYRVRVAGMRDGAPIEVVWKFTTR
jgi:uncharacterized protein YkwD